MAWILKDKQNKIVEISSVRQGSYTENGDFVEDMRGFEGATWTNDTTKTVEQLLDEMDALNE